MDNLFNGFGAVIKKTVQTVQKNQGLLSHRAKAAGLMKSPRDAHSPTSGLLS